MQKINYIVTFTGKYPCGHRHPLIEAGYSLENAND